MPILSLCGTIGANTGPIACDVTRAIPKVLVLGGKRFTPSDYATSADFQEALIDAIGLATGDSDKMYPFPETQNVTNNTEANVTATTGLGFTKTLREGRPAYTFGVFAGSSQEKQLRKFNGSTVPGIIFDSNGNVWGKLNEDGSFSGSNLQIFVSAKPFSDGSSIDSEYTNVTIAFENASDFGDYAAFVPTDFNVSDLEGLLNASLVQVTVSNTNVRKIAALYKGAQLNGNLNIGDKYSTELADPTLWTLKRADTGAPIAITSIAWDAAQAVVGSQKPGAFTVTIDNTAYGALPTNTKLLLNLVAPPLLKAEGAIGIEGVELSLLKAA
jgi:hypothetical protein